MTEETAHGAGKSQQLLLAAITATAASAEVLRRAQRMARAFGCPWIALYVEPASPLRERDHEQISRALALARELGAEVITTTSSNFADSLLRVARQRNVTQVIVERPPAPFWRFFNRDRYLRRLAREAGGIDVHVVSTTAGQEKVASSRWQSLKGSTWGQYAFAIFVIVAITVNAALLGSRIGPPHAAALIFLLGVVVVGCFVGRGPTLVAALMSALLWDFFVLPPIYKLSLDHIEDGIVSGMYFIVALVIGQLTTRIRRQQEIERLGEERATALYLLTRELSEAASEDQIIEKTVRQMERVFQGEIAVMLADGGSAATLATHPASTFKPLETDREAVAWVIKQAQMGGRFTPNISHAEALYAPLAASEGVIGVVGIRFRQSSPPTVHQLNLLEAFREQVVLALERLRLRKISEKAQLLAQSEQLAKMLLDSMSHEIRTPIAAITSATSTLVEIEKTQPHPLQTEMVREIEEATGRLNRLVGNFLEVSHLESGVIKPNINDCEVSDLINTVMADMEKELAGHGVQTSIDPGLPLVPMDFVLMQQALTNLLSNAALHTPPGTQIALSARTAGDTFELAVADSGAGIPAASLEHIFEKFYRAPNAPAGGTGLGLSLVKGFMEAQGGAVRVENRVQGGARFTLSLPVSRKVPTKKSAL